MIDTTPYAIGVRLSELDGVTAAAAVAPGDAPADAVVSETKAWTKRSEMFKRYACRRRGFRKPCCV
jgi:hypothetical protein